MTSKVTRLAASGTIWPLASVTSTSMYDRSLPSAVIVLRSASALSFAALPVVVTDALPSVDPSGISLLFSSYASAEMVPSAHGTFQVRYMFLWAVEFLSVPS